MKAFKLFLLTIFAALGLAAQAQTIEVYKDGQVIDSFSAAQVDSVVYKYAEPKARYYYYAGWECPTNETELASKGTLIGNSYAGFEYDYTLEANQLHSTVGKATVYVVVPGNIEIWSSDKNDKLSGTSFQEVTTISIPNHKVYASVDTFRNVDMIVLMKK